MRLFFGGAEIGTHRAILQEIGVKNVAMSYMGLRRRVKFSKPWNVAEKFDPWVSVFLDSGAYTINADPEEQDPDELIGIYEHYRQFVNENLDRLEMVSEFDALPLGVEWIEEQREDFWKQIPREKFMAIWHPVWGISYLQEMASQYEIIGIPATSLEGRNLRPVLNALAVKGTRIHGIAMTKIEEMQTIRWDSVASTSWISPQRYGDTIVWTGNELKRYPKKYKETARKRHRTLFTSKGFDADKIANDQDDEVLRLSVWSWQQFEEYVNKHHKSGKVATPMFSNGPEPTAEEDPEVVDPLADEGEPTVPTTKALAKPREVIGMLPVMGLTTAKSEDDDDESEGDPIINIRSESARVCDTCFLAEKCPAYEPGSNCAYNIPVMIRTREQFKALQYGLLEMQTQRVFFMRFAEEMEGGYADPNLTKEMGLLQKMMATTAEMEKEGFSITLNARGSSPVAGAGVISRMFGNDAGQRVQQIESGPVFADDVIDAEILEDK